MIKEIAIFLSILVLIHLGFFTKRIASVFTKKRYLLRGIGFGVPVAVVPVLFFCRALGTLVIILHVAFISLVIQILYYIVIKIFRMQPSDRIDMVYRLGIVPILITAIIMVFGYINAKNIVRTQYTLESKKITSPAKIAMISDVHLDVTLNAEDLKKYAEAISRENPDVLILDGDMFDNYTSKKEMQSAAATLGKVHTKYGIYYVYGNHDMNIYGMRMDFSISEMESALVNSGIIVLADNEVSAGPFEIAGRLDASISMHGGSRASIKSLLRDADMNKYVIMADHQPRALKENAIVGVDLELSGHTHAGQIWPFGYACKWLELNEMNYGLYTDGKFNAITSSGLGGWGFPIRTQGHSEYVIINLRPR